MENKVQNMVNLLNQKYGNEKREYTFTEAKKYFKVWCTSWGSKSIYAFVDRDGNIFKPAGLNAPAKHVRGTVDDPLACCGEYSVNYLRMTYYNV